MPLEIRELIIKTTVDSNASNSSGTNNQMGNNEEAKFNEIVERILEIIKQKSER